MAIIQDVARQENQNGRVAGMFGDGVYTRYIEVVQGRIVICDSDLDAEGRPVVRHVNDDIRYLDFVPRTISTRRSGFDGKLIVTLGGYTPNTGDSRRVTVKCDLVIEPAL
jgi:hypothetical protein